MNDTKRINVGDNVISVRSGWVGKRGKVYDYYDDSYGPAFAGLYCVKLHDSVRTWTDYESGLEVEPQ